jgi:hypothetical protein
MNFSSTVLGRNAYHTFNNLALVAYKILPSLILRKSILLIHLCTLTADGYLTVQVVLPIFKALKGSWTTSVV